VLAFLTASAASAQVSSHVAQSRFSFDKDASGCPTSHITNTRFVYLGDTALVGKVFRESISTEHCLTAEATSGAVDVKAWRANASTADRPLFSFQDSGEEAAIEGSFYRTTELGCCGTGDLSRYHSLENGRELFAVSGRLLRIKIAGGAERVIAVHDTYSATLPREADADSTVAAVFEYGDGVSPSRRWVIRTKTHAYYKVDSLYFIRAGKPDYGTEQWFTRSYAERRLPIVISDISVVIVLATDTDDTVLRVEIPIENDGPRLSKAIVTPALTISPQH
jgi:hypothetical protein